MITDIKDESFYRFPNLYQLDVSENQLSFLRPSVFRGLTGLYELNLAFNRLKAINVAVFINLPYLMGLNLTGNLIKHVEGRFSLVPQIVEIGLGFNQLNSINATTFSNSVQLMKLWLDFNQISTISPNAFTNCRYLWFIDLTGNLLNNSTHIKEFLQNKITNLVLLNLQKNNISTILPFMFSQNPDQYPFQLLSLDSNQIGFIDKDAFTNITALLHLLLGNNLLTYLHPDTFKTNRILDTVYLNDNYLQSIPAMSESLAYLYLTNNCIKSLPLFNNTMHNLIWLLLYGNPLNSLHTNSFAEFPSILALNVSRCNLSYISDDAFYNNSQLKYIDLSQNNLNINFSVDYWKTTIILVNLSHNSIRSANNLFLHTIRYANTIDLSNNPLVVFPDQTKQGSSDKPIIYTERLFLKNCSLTKVSEYALEMAINIELVDLSSNNLTQLKPFKLHKQSGESAYRVILDNNPILCSCEMSWLKDEQYRLHYVVPFCTLVTTGEVKNISSVARDDFLCRVTEFCTIELSGCECYTDDIQNAPTQLDCSYKLHATFPKYLEQSFKRINFQGNAITAFKDDSVSITLNELEELYLRSNQIVDVEAYAFVKFPNLLILDLSENRIVNINRETFSSLERLKLLYLNNNFIRTIDGSSFGKLYLLQILTLHNNSLGRLTTDNMADIESLAYLSQLTLYDNPWSCPCDNGTFKNWIQYHSEIIPNIFEILCNDTPIVNIPDENLLCYDLNTKILLSQFFIEILTVSCGFCVLLFSTTLIVYRFRYVVQVLLFSKFGLRQKRRENEMCCYDALTIYDNSDVLVRQWIKNVLIVHLEPKFKLFIPDRDMLAGTDKNNELVKAVKVSQRTIVVISNALSRWQEVPFVFEVAYHYAKFEKSDHYVLLILLDGITCKKILADNELDSNLKACLKSDKCLSVSDKLFWQKVLFFLPKQRPPNRGDEHQPIQRSCYTISS